jgi:hypothetical protein
MEKINGGIGSNKVACDPGKENAMAVIGGIATIIAAPTALGVGIGSVYCASEK